VKRRKGALAPPLDNEPHRLDAHVLERAQRVIQHAAPHHEDGLGAVDAGRRPGQAQPLAHLLEIDRQLVGEVDIAIHHAGHEFHRVIGLEPGGLVAHHRVGGGVGLVEAVIGEFLQQVKDLVGLAFVHTVGHRARLEFRAFPGHLGGDLLAHGAAQQIGAAKAVARHDLRDLHHLFLIDDDALGLFEDVVDQRMDALDLAQPVLDLAIGRDVLHRAGTVERDQRHDILDAGGFHPLERVHHARAFHLEHRDRARAGIHLVGLCIIKRDLPDIVLGPRRGLIDRAAIGGDMQIAPPRADPCNGVLDDGQRLQPQKVELHQPRLFHPFHVELRGGHVRARIAIDRHQLVKRAIADHHARGMGRGIAQQPLDLLAIGQKPAHHLLGLRRLAQARLVGQRLLDRDGLDPLDGDHLRQPVHLPIRHLQHPPQIAHRSL